MDDPKTPTEAEDEAITSTQDPWRLGQPDAESDRPSHPTGGSKAGGSTGGNPSGEVGTVPEAAGDRLRGRHPEGVLRPEVVDQLRDDLTEAFQKGDPAQAWELTQELLRVAGESVVDVAKSRFQVNFGTDLCRNCVGLHAGPGVVATCYQVQQCYFQNFREDTLSSRQSRILTILGKDS